MPDKSLNVHIRSIMGPETARMQSNLQRFGVTMEGVGKKGQAAMGNIEKGARGAGQGLDQASKSGRRFFRDVLQAFLLYKGFVFLQTQIQEMVGELVNLEHELAIVQTQLNDLGEDFRPEIRENVLRTGAETGIALSELAKAEFEIVSANIAVADSYEILDLAARAAVAGGLKNAEEAFNAALTQVNAFNLAIEDFNEVFDKQFNLVKRGIFTYEQLTTTIGTVSVVFAGMGQSIETSNAALAAISQVFTGRQLERGATGLANAVRRMTFQFEQFGELGLEVVDPLTGEFRNLVDIIEDLNAALDGLTESERAARIKQLFPDIRQQRGISTLLTQEDQFRQFFVEQQFSTGDLEQAFGTVEETTKVYANRLKNSLVPESDKLTNTFKDLIQATTEMVEGFKAFFKDIGEAFDELIGEKGLARDVADDFSFVNIVRAVKAFDRFAREVLDPSISHEEAFQRFQDAAVEATRDDTEPGPSEMGDLIELARQEFSGAGRRGAFATALPEALRQQELFDIFGGSQGQELEDRFEGADLTLAKIIESAIFEGLNLDEEGVQISDEELQDKIADALKIFAEEGADAFLVALDLLSPPGGESTLLDPLEFPATISFQSALMEGAQAIREGLVDPMGFTADQLEMMGEEVREFNRLLKVRSILEEIGKIGEFIGVDVDMQAVLREVFDDLKSLGPNLEDLFSDPRKLADFLSNMEFGDISIDQREQNVFTFRFSGDTDISDAAKFVDEVQEEWSKRAREASAT